MQSTESAFPLRVLIIDDQAERAVKLSSWLRTLTCKTSVGFDARSGVRLSELFRPSLVFIHLGLPEGQALLVRNEIVRVLGSRVPLFVGMDASGTFAGTPEGRELGFHWLAVPPLDPQQIHQILDAAAAHREESWERSLTGRRLETRPA